MTRNQPTASPTQLSSPSRLWRGLAALMFSFLLAPAAAFADEPAAPAAHSATEAAAPAPVAAPVATDPALAEGAGAPADDAPQVIAEEDNSLGMAHDLSPWGMYKNADIIVKIVMIGLAIASIITWTIWIAKGFEVLGAKRRLRGEIANLKKARTLQEASETAAKEGTLAHLLVQDAMEEMRLTANDSQTYVAGREWMFTDLHKEWRGRCPARFLARLLPVGKVRRRSVAGWPAPGHRVLPGRSTQSGRVWRPRPRLHQG